MCLNVSLKDAGLRSTVPALFPLTGKWLFARVGEGMQLNMARSRSAVPTALPLARKRLLARVCTCVSLEVIGP